MSDQALRTLQRAYETTGTIQDYAAWIHAVYQHGGDREDLPPRGTRIAPKQYSAIRFVNPDRLNIRASIGWFPCGGQSLRLCQIFDGHAIRRLYVEAAPEWGEAVWTESEWGKACQGWYP